MHNYYIVSNYVIIPQGETLPTDDLKRQILALLNSERKWMRNSEIVQALSRNQNLEEAFTVKTTRRLLDLVKDGDVKRDPKGHKNVRYKISRLGINRVRKIFLSDWINSPRPHTEVQVLQFLVHVLFSEVSFTARPNTSFENLIIMLRDRLNKEDIVELARTWKNDL